ncbi:MAG TPA: ATP-binding protein [Bacteroidales bacterium]|nr:ATP-binding protein [Bacteroidales bacterium]
MIKKIAVTGPESTGKSAMAEKLAIDLNTVWVPEYAREYIGKLNRPYTSKDIEIIARHQIALEDELLTKANGVLICDTDLIVTKIWSDFVFGFCPDWIENEIVNRPYDLYLLMNIDLPWQEDPQREHPDRREELFNNYKFTLEKYQLPYSVISGIGKNRQNNAREVIKSHRLI